MGKQWFLLGGVVCCRIAPWMVVLWLLDASWTSLEPNFEPLGRLLERLGHLLERLGRLWERLGQLLDVFGAQLGASWAPLAASWAPLRASWAALGASWAPLGANLGALGCLLGPTWPLLGASWTQLGASWELLGPTWPLLGSTWSFWGAFGTPRGHSKWLPSVSDLFSHALPALPARLACLRSCPARAPGLSNAKLCTVHPSVLFILAFCTASPALYARPCWSPWHTL